MTTAYHEPVMVGEVLTVLRVGPGSRIVDATLGGGGHAKAMIAAGAKVLGIDQDDDVLANFAAVPVTGLTPVKGNFRRIAEIVRTSGWDRVDGVLMDLGVSSHQFDVPERGFSIRNPEVRLDMRMDVSREETAADILAQSNREKLYEIFTSFGEEECAGRIADAVVRARRLKEVATAGDLMNAIADGTGTDGEALKRHAVRVFQALRICVNDELGALREGIGGAGEILAPEGRLAVLSYHSLEDRIVKLALRGEMWKEVTKKPVLPGETEIRDNGRARSAKLRVAEKR